MNSASVVEAEVLPSCSALGWQICSCFITSRSDFILFIYLFRGFRSLKVRKPGEGTLRRKVRPGDLNEHFGDSSFPRTIVRGVQPELHDN